MSPAAKKKGNRAEEEVQRLMEVARTLARILGYSNRELERRGNLHHTTMMRNFQGTGEPKVQFLLELIQALGLDFAEFFELAYSGRRKGTTEAAQKVRQILQRLSPGHLGPFGAPEPEPPPAPASEDFAAMLAELRREIQELREERATPRAPQPKKKRVAS